MIGIDSRKIRHNDDVAIPFLGSILVTGTIVTNISTCVNLFITDVILLIIDRVVEPKLMDNYIMIGLLAAGS
ncbi:hypothetical protein [Lysinibacillus xylanilyticus]|uniref:Uncharacterized protein n=1 Tax=Lysinibacillus xylanilyticus TaxID=582475 RepID=A0ABT4EU26_9BACI|nr:hypothetical protein [Lysinibacillus xylanilyticus]MCY9549180.1 hypothetical protein [Lysinibacillus xylanilyticus]MED3800613.1 hypothetical protein [Lysinibacillus xylanilyticus]